MRHATMMRCAAATLLLVPGRVLFAQCPDGTPPPCAGRARPVPTAQSVAVLPFENRARDSTLVLLAEGLADEITTNLGRIARLQVSSPSAVRFALGRGARDPRRLGQALGARWLVDGQLLSGSGSVRVSVQLVEAARGTMRWSVAFERPADDLLGLIRSIADSVGLAIVGTLAPAEQALLAARPTRSAAAYEAYVRGRAALRQGAGQNLHVAAAFFEEATRSDSLFVEAWAAQASTWVSMADNLFAPRVANARARQYAERALAIDRAHGEATAALAKIAMWHDWDLPGAVLLARRAAALAPVSADAHLVLGLALAARGDTVAAAAELLRAVDLDSLSARTINNAALGLLFLGRYEIMEQRGRRVMATEATVAGGRMVVYALEARGACEDARPLRASLPDTPTSAINLCQPATDASLARIAREMADARATRPYFRAWQFARLYALVGLPDSAMQLLEQSFRDREAFMPFIHLDPGFRAVHNDARFRELVRRVAGAAGAL